MRHSAAYRELSTDHKTDGPIAQEILMTHRGCDPGDARLLESIGSDEGSVAYGSGCCFSRLFRRRDRTAWVKWMEKLGAVRNDRFTQDVYLPSGVRERVRWNAGGLW